jgi:hypothetical protein
MDKISRSHTEDWVSNARISLLAWWIPAIAILAALFAPVGIRAGVWIAALLWMGTACMLNARHCGRTHCRYTGPFFLMMIVPVLGLGFGVVSTNIYGWLALALSIVASAGSIWWLTERAWGKFS